MDVFSSVSVKNGNSWADVTYEIRAVGATDVDAVTSATSVTTTPVPGDYDINNDDEYRIDEAWLRWKMPNRIGAATIGRQRPLDSIDVRMDGLKYTSEPRSRTGVKSAKLAVFGGQTVHWYENSASGDSIVGGGAECRPIPELRFGIIYARIVDEPHYEGLPSGLTAETDNILKTTMIVRTNAEVGGSVVHTLSDGTTRDISFRIAGLVHSIGFDYSVGIDYQPKWREDAGIESASFVLALEPIAPHQRMTLHSGWTPPGSLWRFDADATIRRLSDSSDEGPYNREYGMIRFGVRREISVWTLNAGLSDWSSGGEDVIAFDAGCRYRPNDAWTVSLGTAYTMFSYDYLDGEERERVREVSVKLGWMPLQYLSLRLSMAYENASENDRIEVRSGCSVVY
ncbi:MAG: hypothetical protein ABIH86_06025 [Planctomycetota bacterium]